MDRNTINNAFGGAYRELLKGYQPQQQGDELTAIPEVGNAFNMQPPPGWTANTNPRFNISPPGEMQRVNPRFLMDMPSEDERQRRLREMMRGVLR